MASQDDLLNMYLYGGQSPNQVDLMQQLQSMQKPAQVAPQIQQQPLVFAPGFQPAPKPTAAPQPRRQVAPQPKVPQLPSQTVAELQYEKPTPTALTQRERVEMAANELRDQANRPLTVPEVSPFESLFPPKSKVPSNDWDEITKRSMPGTESERQSVEEMAQMFKDLQLGNSPNVPEVYGKMLLDIWGGKDYIPKLADAQKENVLSKMKAQSLLTGARKDLSENEIKLLNAQFQNLGQERKLAADQDIKIQQMAAKYGIDAQELARKMTETALNERKQAVGAAGDIYKGEMGLLKDQNKPVRPLSKNSNMSPGIKAYETGKGKALADWESTGLSSAQFGLSNLESAKELLKKNPDLTGGTFANIAPGAAEKLTRISNPELNTIMQNLNNSMEGTIKSSLPGSISDADLRFLRTNAIDMRVSAQKNIENIQRKIDKIEEIKAKNAKAKEYFLQHGQFFGDTSSQESTQKSALKRQVNKRTGEVRYLDQNGNVVK